MSVIEEAIRNKLLNDANVSALVGTRIYTNEIPQKPTYPVILYEQINSERDFTMQGPSGIVTTSIQIRAYDSNYSGVKDLTTKIRQVLNGLTETILGVNIFGIFLQNESDEYDEDLEINSTILDYSISHDEVL